AIQTLVRGSLHKLDLLPLDFFPFVPHRGGSLKQVAVEYRISSQFQFTHELHVQRLRFPELQPDPFARNDVKERIPNRSKASAKIACELRLSERGRRVKDPPVRPAVILIQKLNVGFRHGNNRPTTVL